MFKPEKTNFSEIPSKKEKEEKDLGDFEKQEKELNDLFKTAKEAENYYRELSETEDQEKKLKLEEKVKKFTAGSKEVIEIKSDIPEGFNAGDILKQGRERFADFLKNLSLRVLVGYIEAGGVNLQKTKEIPKEWKEEIEEVRQKKRKFMIISPKLYFLSKKQCAEIALEELLARITGETKK